MGPETPPEGVSAGETAKALSLAKAREVAENHPDGTVIGADTVVAIDDKILGKPHSQEQAAQMLSLLSGREHRVYTGVTVIRGGRTLSRWEETKVFFRTMTEEEIAAYVATGEPMDKAGAYGYQGRASVYVERIEGDFFNGVGLPLCRLGTMLSELGVTLH